VDDPPQHSWHAPPPPPPLPLHYPLARPSSSSYAYIEPRSISPPMQPRSHTTDSAIQSALWHAHFQSAPPNVYSQLSTMNPRPHPSEEVVYGHERQPSTVGDLVEDWDRDFSTASRSPPDTGSSRAPSTLSPVCPWSSSPDLSLLTSFFNDVLQH
jgi:hypothetical protein